MVKPNKSLKSQTLCCSLLSVTGSHVNKWEKEKESEITGHLSGCTATSADSLRSKTDSKVIFEVGFSAFPSEEVNHEISCNSAGQMGF